MPIFRVYKNKTHPYTIIDNTPINDKRLSAKAKGILLYLISKPNYWFINLPNLISAFTDGERSIRTGINELIKFGYIIRTHARKKDGRFSFYDYAVYEQPFTKPIDSSVSLPERQNAVLDNPVLDNSTLLNTNIKTNTERKTTTGVISVKPPIFTPNAAASLFKKNSTIELLNDLKIINHNKLFDLFPISVIFEYASWIKSRGCKMKNPTGFLITAIKEHWLEYEHKDNTPGLSIFFQLCSVCDKHFAYEEYEPKYTICKKCRTKSK